MGKVSNITRSLDTYKKVKAQYGIKNNYFDMKRKKLLTSELQYVLYNNQKIMIGKSTDNYIFEIGNQITNDLAEGVSILMSIGENDPNIWNLEIDSENIELTPAKTLFWLSGGESEWSENSNYKIPWCECFPDFQEEFGILVINIVKGSKTLADIRDGFRKHLNLPILYDFALHREIIY